MGRWSIGSLVVSHSSPAWVISINFKTSRPNCTLRAKRKNGERGEAITLISCYGIVFFCDTFFGDAPRDLNATMMQPSPEMHIAPAPLPHRTRIKGTNNIWIQLNFKQNIKYQPVVNFSGKIKIATERYLPHQLRKMKWTFILCDATHHFADTAEAGSNFERMRNADGGNRFVLRLTFCSRSTHARGSLTHTRSAFSFQMRLRRLRRLRRSIRFVPNLKVSTFRRRKRSFSNTFY